jgi:hypothetical protein
MFHLRTNCFNNIFLLFQQYIFIVLKSDLCKNKIKIDL